MHIPKPSDLVFLFFISKTIRSIIAKKKIPFFVSLNINPKTVALKPKSLLSNIIEPGLITEEEKRGGY